MLFMAIERFKDGSLEQVGERFRHSGRMLPEGVIYHASWMEPSGARCFQLMEASHPGLLRDWASHWEDLVDLEIVPVQTSNEFWTARGAGSAPA
jgi:uncharacterized protein DUF3303